MGACSSKPKTTEFEGSVEPQKPADVAADQPRETGRALESLADEHDKGASIKAEGGEAATASMDAVHTTPELDVGKDEVSSKEIPSRSAEGSSEAQSYFLREKEEVKETSGEMEQKEYKGDGVSDEVVQKDDEIVQKDDVGGGGGIVDSESANSFCAVNKEASVVDEAKTCEDKAVVTEDSGRGQGDAAYVDKAVALGKEKAPETPEKRNIIVPEDEASAMLDSAESAGIESPIIGVVLPVEPRNKAMNEEDVPKNVEADKVGEHDDSLQDSKVAKESPATCAEDVNVRVIATEDVQEDVEAPPRENCSEASGVEILSPTIAIETLSPANACETLSPAVADSLKDGEEGTPQPHGETPSDAAVDVSSATMDSKIDDEKFSTVSKAGAPVDESIVNLNEDSHATTLADGVSADSLELETQKATEDTVPEVSTTELKANDAQEESCKQKSGWPTVEVMDVTKALGTEAVEEDGRPTVALSESIPEREEKVEQTQESTVEAAKETSDKPHVEHMNSGDVAFEDASDVPLKSEAIKTIESGQVPS